MSLGAVYDRGYRPYDGPRGGRNASRLALFKLSVRRALGLRRSWRQKVFPWTLLGFATIPAIINVGVGYLTRDSPARDFEFITYREYVGVSTVLLLFVALTAPDVVCPDRRYRVLPLIFARPLTGADYVLAKVGAIFAVVFGFSFVPHVVLFVGQLLVADEGALEYFTDNADVLWKVPVSVVLLAAWYSIIGVALASLTTRRIVGGVIFLAVLFVSAAIGGVLTEANGGQSAWGVLDWLELPLYLRDVVFLGHIHPRTDLGGVAGAAWAVAGIYVAVLASCLVLLRTRYREVQM